MEKTETSVADSVVKVFLLKGAFWLGCDKGILGHLSRRKGALGVGQGVSLVAGVGSHVWSMAQLAQPGWRRRGRLVTGKIRIQVVNFQRPSRYPGKALCRCQSRSGAPEPRPG